MRTLNFYVWTINPMRKWSDDESPPNPGWKLVIRIPRCHGFSLEIYCLRDIWHWDVGWRVFLFSSNGYSITIHWFSFLAPETRTVLNHFSPVGNAHFCGRGLDSFHIKHPTEAHLCAILILVMMRRTWKAFGTWKGWEIGWIRLRFVRLDWGLNSNQNSESKKIRDPQHHNIPIQFFPFLEMFFFSQNFSQNL